MTGTLIGARVSHDHATLDAIQSTRVDDVGDTVASLRSRPGVSEAFVLQTCHRNEWYVVAEDETTGRRALDAVVDVPSFAVRTTHAESLHHLLRVGAGLESLVLGEDQVLGQLRDAYEAARESGGVGRVLSTAVTKAIHVGERARTETAINEGVVSLGSAAARLAAREVDLDDSHGLIVGAGEMGQLAAKSLAAAGVASLTVANRTVSRADRVVAELPCPAAATSLDDLPAAVGRADVVVTATGSRDPVLGPSDLADAGETVVVDLGQPRDVRCRDGDGVRLFDLDALESVTDTTRERRRAAADTVESMVEAEFDRLRVQLKRERADEVIAAMYEGAERLKDRELGRALNRLEANGGLTDDQREVVGSLADALVSQLLAAPTRSLRDAAEEDDWETIRAALELFDPEFDGERHVAFSGPRMADVAAEDDD